MSKALFINAEKSRTFNQRKIKEVEDETHKSLEKSDSVNDASKSKVYSLSEKLLPFNKRKSRYYICEEDGSTIYADELSCPGSEPAGKVKIRSLRSIYRRTKPIHMDYE